MRGAERAGSRIVSPVVKGDPLYMWVAGHREGEVPRIGSLPNHFVIETNEPADAVARAALHAVEDAWQGVCNAVWRRVVEKPAAAGHGSVTIWKRQIRSFWEVVWTAGVDPDGGGLLARRKHWRSHRPPDEPGDKCTVMHGLQELSGFVRAESTTSRERQDGFWDRVREHRLVGSLNLRENERLCAIALVKRLFPVVPEALEWTVDASRWPSTVSIGASPWLKRAKAIAPAEVKRYADAVAEAAKRTGAAQPSHTADANWLHVDFVRDERRCPLAPGTAGEVREDLVRLLNTVYRATGDSGCPLGRPSSFYALLKADGDRLGELVREIGSDPVGKALTAFTSEVPEIVARHDGVTVYAGGDDVLAMLPVPGALSCAEALANRYRSAFKAGVGATLSAAVLFTHVRSPLRAALLEAGRLLDDVAKDGNGRDSLAAGVLKPGGLHCLWVTAWTRSDGGRDAKAVESLGQLVRRFAGTDGDAGLSSSLVYRMRKTLSLLCDQPRWEPGAWADPPGDLDIGAFLHAEIRRSLTLLSANGAEERASEWAELVRGVLSRARSDEGGTGTAVGIDGLLLARFLAAPDGEGAGR